ncbi:MAG TPA: hybrid sensor histidine kinase/response regulator, partial [Planctomycetaceae bacterium]|nr:hybrid sensor histidine kinase/response regulator [Planctomycetaceae bacterium]
KTRMQPVGNVFNKFPRIVRDLSKAARKQVQLKIEGAETELDRSIIESIKDPLTHMVRNSIDHGIEAPDVRVQKEKPAAGTLVMRAYHEGGQVIIEIQDDGAGIDPEKIKQKAVEKGVITQEQAETMGNRDALMLIFQPGFSTAEKVTNISGRGVGMDVVRTNIEKLGGTVELQSEVGQGTTVRIKIPLTLAIIPALVVRCGGQRYCIPQVNLVELVHLRPRTAKPKRFQNQRRPVQPDLPARNYG